MSTIAQPIRSPLRLWRDERVLKALAQIVFLVLLFVLLAYLWGNATRALREAGLTTGFGFMRTTAGFDIGESIIPYGRGTSYWRAFAVGVVNTLRVVVVGIVACTLLGLLVGIARLSSNWMVRALAGSYVEIVRNTPLLLQLFFFYFAVIFSMPRVRDAIQLPGSIYLSNRGVVLPRVLTGGGLPIFLGGVLLALAAAFLTYRWRSRRELDTGRASYPLSSGLAAFLVVSGAAWLISGGQALSLSIPELRGFNFTGGLILSPEFFALLFGLVVYTAAFIAEIVRGAILSVSRGQTEAALAVGLNRLQTLRLVVLPQALRIIVPPLTSQYLNLAKNSSLAVAIGYPDLFSVAKTISNQTGRAIEVIALIMASYLTVSLVTSAFMNWYNARIRLVER